MIANSRPEQHGEREQRTVWRIQIGYRNSAAEVKHRDQAYTNACFLARKRGTSTRQLQIRPPPCQCRLADRGLPLLSGLVTTQRTAATLPTQLVPIIQRSRCSVQLVLNAGRNRPKRSPKTSSMLALCITGDLMLICTWLPAL